jgi:hypothetical protein
MTFEEWFEKQKAGAGTWGLDSFYSLKNFAELAWEAAWKDGNEAGYADGLEDGRINAEAEMNDELEETPVECQGKKNQEDGSCSCYEENER